MLYIYIYIYIYVCVCVCLSYINYYINITHQMMNAYEISVPTNSDYFYYTTNEIKDPLNEETRNGTEVNNNI